jgi:hypothetical protein
MLNRRRSDGFRKQLNPSYGAATAMSESKKLLDLIETAFPVQPRPTAFFSAEGIDAINHDIPQELSKRIAGRPWTEVTLMDWRMIGVSPVISRRYLEPASFMYYVPSILLGVFWQIDFVEFALEGIIPHNKHHSPRGKWWSEFSSCASSRQRLALSAFLSHVRLMFWDRIGPANQSLLERAENIWLGNDV